MFSDMSFQTSMDTLDSESLSNSRKNIATLKKASTLHFSRADSTYFKRNHQTTLQWSLKDALRICSVEPAMFLHSLVYYMMLPVIQKLMMEKLCEEDSIGDVFGEFSCSNETYDENDVDLDRNTANYLMYHTLVQVAPGILFCIILGSWSDNHGRKLPMILSTIGAFMSHLGMLLLVIYKKNYAYLILVATIPYGLLGGPASFALSAHSYLSDMSTTSSRMLRYSILDVMTYAGGPLGVFIGGRLHHYFGYKCVFLVASCIDVLTLCYVAFIIRETVQDLGSFGGHYYWDLVNLKSLFHTFRSVFRTREFELHKSVNFVLIIHCVISITLRGEEFIGFLYVHSKFNWSLVIYTVFIGYYMIMCLSGLLLATPLFSWKLKVSDARLGGIGCISRCIASIFLALSTNSLMVFIAATMGLLSNLASVSVRTIMSKIVDQDEIGKAFSVMCLIDSLSPIVASILYSQLYSATLENFPEFVYLLSAALVSIAYFCFGWLRKNLDPEVVGDLDLGEKRPLLEELDFQEEVV